MYSQNLAKYADMEMLRRCLLITRGSAPHAGRYTWRLRLFAALLQLPDAAERDLVDWILGETAAEWSVQRFPLPGGGLWGACGLRGSGRWEASDRGGHYSRIREYLFDRLDRAARFRGSIPRRAREMFLELHRDELLGGVEPLLAWCDEEDRVRKEPALLVGYETRAEVEAWVDGRRAAAQAGESAFDDMDLVNMSTWEHLLEFLREGGKEGYSVEQTEWVWGRLHAGWGDGAVEWPFPIEAGDWATA